MTLLKSEHSANGVKPLKKQVKTMQKLNKRVLNKVVSLSRIMLKVVIPESVKLVQLCSKK
jgi:hypothetical protein